MRLQKYLSQAGICSRRKWEEYIERGLVTVNGEVAIIGQSIIVWKDIVELQDQVVEEQKNLVYYKFHKPRGIETTCAQRWGKSIIDIIDTPERVFPVWRLDKETTGLILMTNDGRLANYLMHPRYEHEKEYIVETFGPIDDNALQLMSKGLHILWKQTKEAKVVRKASGKFSITITEWRNRQIRRMVEKVEGKVKRLKRIRIENIELWKLNEWELRHLSQKEIKGLFHLLDIENFT